MDLVSRTEFNQLIEVVKIQSEQIKDINKMIILIFETIKKIESGE